MTETDVTTEKKAHGGFWAVIYRILAVISFLAMLGLLGFWSYRMIVFDPADLPVIRKHAGPLRERPAPTPPAERPQDPGITQIAAGPDTAPEEALIAPPPVAVPEADLTPAPQTPVITAPEVPPPAAEPTPAPVPEEAPEIPEAEPEDTSEFAISQVARAPKRPAGHGGSVIEKDFVEWKDIPNGAPMVQVGSFDSEPVALIQWDSLMQREGTLLRGLKRYIEPVKVSNRTHYRLRLVGFESRDVATAICATLKQRGVDCFVAVK